ILVLRALRDVAVQHCDRFVRVAVLLQSCGELALGCGALRVLLQLLARVVDRDVAARGAVVAANEVTERRILVGADPEADEADREDEREEDEHPLRVPAQPREEHRVLERYEVTVALWSMRPRLARAASISS